MMMEDLRILVMFCSNRVNGQKFLELMMPRYNDENYIMNLWPQFRDNPTMLVATLLARCIAEVPDAPRLPTANELKRLPIGQTDLLILELRELTLGEDFMEYDALCPDKACRKPNPGTVLLANLRVEKLDIDTSEVVLDSGILQEGKKLKKVTIKPVNGFIQEKFIKKKEADQNKFGEMSTELIQAVIVDINGIKVTRDMVSAMTRRDRKKIQGAIESMQGPSAEIIVNCRGCGNDFKYTLNVLDFLA